MINSKARRLRWARLVTLALLLVLMPVTAHGMLVGLKQNSNGTVDLVVVDPETGITVTLRADTGLNDVYGITFDSKRNKLFAASYGDTNQDPNAYPVLYSIDWQTLAIDTIGPICSTNPHRCEGLAYNPADDKLYATVNRYPGTWQTNELVTVDRGTGACTAVGPIQGTAQNDGDDIVFAEGALVLSDGIVSTTAESYFYLIDTDSNPGSVLDQVLHVLVTGVRMAYDELAGLIYYVGDPALSSNSPQWLYFFDPDSLSHEPLLYLGIYETGIRGLASIKPLYVDIMPGTCVNHLSVSGDYLEVAVMGYLDRYDLANLKSVQLQRMGSRRTVRAVNRLGSSSDVGAPSSGMPFSCQTTSPDLVTDEVVQFKVRDLVRAFDLSVGEEVTFVVQATFRDRTTLVGLDRVTIVP